MHNTNSNATIHSSAIIHAGATIGAKVSIGPYCVIGPNVVIGEGSILHSHVVIDGFVKIGKKVQIYPFSAIGMPPQDLKFRGEETTIEIGDFTVIRENCTIHPGTDDGIKKTTIGAHCLLMVGVHIAHDCEVDDHVILANYSNLAGHVRVGHHAILGGLSGIHQFVRIGEHAIIGGGSIVDSDVVPYGHVLGERSRLSGINIIGMKRHNVDKQSIVLLRQVFEEIFISKTGTIEDRAKMILQSYPDHPIVLSFCSFVLDRGKMPLCLYWTNH